MVFLAGLVGAVGVRSASATGAVVMVTGAVNGGTLAVVMAGTVVCHGH